MTQPSPEDDLPPGPWSVIQFGFEWDVVAAESVGFICRVRTEPIASAIAAIPERMEQINQLAAQLIEAEKYNGWHQQAVLEIDHLRAENAELLHWLREAATVLNKGGSWNNTAVQNFLKKLDTNDMTQPSPQDDLPPGPWTVFEWTDHWSVMDATGCGFAHAWKERDARAIAAIPEMRAELREAKMKYESEVRLVDEVEKDCDRLRAEKAELIELLTARLIRRYRHANETVKTSSEGSTSAPEGS